MVGVTVTQDMVRSALQSFGTDGQIVSNAQLYDALGLEAEPEKARLRTRINDMIKFGEVERVESGCYRYNFKHRPRTNKSFPAIWRFVRKSKPGWSLSECALMTRIGYTQVLRYCGWLEKQDYIVRVGKNDSNAITYRATPKADQAPETPWPPLRDTDPFAREKSAAASIARLMLCHDPYAAKTARDIVAACKTLLNRFEKTVIENENENNHNEGESTC